jgi:hypothetical protein
MIYYGDRAKAGAKVGPANRAMGVFIVSYCPDHPKRPPSSSCESVCAASSRRCDGDSPLIPERATIAQAARYLIRSRHPNVAPIPEANDASWPTPEEQPTPFSPHCGVAAKIRTSVATSKVNLPAYSVSTSEPKQRRRLAERSPAATPTRIFPHQQTTSPPCLPHDEADLESGAFWIGNPGYVGV